MAQTSYPKTASTSYNASTQDTAIDILIEQWGDRLEKAALIDKIHLLSILAMWQAADSDAEENPDLYDRWDLVDAMDNYPCEVSANVGEMVSVLHDNAVSDQATFSLMVALVNQVVAEQK